MTIKKKIAAIAAAAMMAMSMTAISASAANTDIYDCTLEQSDAKYTYNGKRAYGILAVGMDGQVEYNSTITGNFFAETYYRAPANYIRATLEVKTGATLLDTYQQIKNNTTTTPSRALVTTDDDYGVVTLYASHEIRINGINPWGEYTAIRNVR